MIVLLDPKNDVYDKAIVIHEELDQSILDIVGLMESIHADAEEGSNENDEPSLNDELL